MFTVAHFIWLAISAILITAFAAYLLKHRPEVNSVLNVSCALSVLSELIKIFCAFRFVPSASGAEIYPFIETAQLPFHLCSIFIFFVFYTRFTKNESGRDVVLAFMYPAGIAGASFALAIPTVFSESTTVGEAFTNPWAYQYFLYHVMLIIVGIYVAFSGKVDIRPHHYFTTIGLLSLFAFGSLYVNSAFAAPVYKDGDLLSVEYTTNFLFTYQPPIDIALTEKWHWILYLLVLVVLAISLITLCYIPIFRRHRRKKAA